MVLEKIGEHKEKIEKSVNWSKSYEKGFYSEEQLEAIYSDSPRVLILFFFNGNHVLAYYNAK